MELEFYKLKNYESNVWFTDATREEFDAWVKENKITYHTTWIINNRIGFVPSEHDRVMFELFWGYDVRAPNRDLYYDDWADVAWSDWDDDEH